jgi:hypothetical protein
VRRFCGAQAEGGRATERNENAALRTGGSSRHYESISLKSIALHVRSDIIGNHINTAMPKGYAPTAFVSSTCYDLSQVRADLKDFLSDLGFEPLLSEISSFPVNPHSTTIENCVNAVKERADIFVLLLPNKWVILDGFNKNG